MKHKLLAVAGATVLAAGLLFAQTGSTPAPNPPATAHGQGFHRRPMFARLARNLNLSDAQRQQAKSIFQDLRTQAKPIRTQLQQGRLALVNAAVAGKSADELNQLAQTVAPQFAQLAALRAQALGKLYAILTPAQQQQFQTMQAKLASHASGQTAN
ncbi:MAG: Spy/CpxP family protein refolding chaperone [Bryobacteraceae bacterium]|jgi:Spy/CpxP family protein refolding chaperone